MDIAIARLNIEHFHKLLATEQDETRRQTLASSATGQRLGGRFCTPIPRLKGSKLHAE